MTVLGGNEFRTKGNDFILSGSYDCRSNCAVVVGGLTVFVFSDRAIVAMDILGGKIPDSIKGNENVPIKSTK